MESVMKKIVILATLLLGLIAGAGPAAAAPVQPVAFEFTTTSGDVCDFPVHVVATGKGKEIDLPGDATILPAPGLTVTFTNTITEKSVSYVITGATHNRTLTNGNVVSTVTGLNTFVNSIEFQHTTLPGIFLVAGTYTFELDSEGHEVQVFSGTGPVTDVCALLK
jgi:hypothetical protein